MKLVVDFEQTGCEVKLNHSVGMTDRDNWREAFLLYERDLAIQGDLEYLTEAVFVFYTKHLDKFIRENDKLWGDFCKKRVDRDGNVLNELELNTHGYDMTIPGMQVPMNKKTVIPEQERHFSFSTKMMVMANDLYEEAPSSFCHFTTFALRKLRQFVESRKEMTAQSYRFFVEHAYNQFFQHEAFHQPATARTKVKERAAGEFHTSTKLEGYVWISGNEKLKHIPKRQAGDVDMEDHDEDADAELDLLPRLQVFVKSQEEKGVCSQERGETQPEEVPAKEYEDALDDAAPIRRPEDRHGQFLVM